MRVTRKIATYLRRKAYGYLAPLVSWWTTIYDSTNPWAFQQDVKVDRAQVEAYWAVFSCVTLIAADIAKCQPRVMAFDRAKEIWQPTLMRPVLRNPNRYQSYLEFIFDWMRCQLLQGNTYVLKERDAEKKIIALYVLDPCRVQVLIAPDGGIYYRLDTDNLAGIDAQVYVPQSEIIHDRMYTLHHPLIGVSPIFSCGVGAMQGIAIQNNSAKFFENMSRPSGILTAPGSISADTATRLKTAWDTNFSGGNIGKVAVLGDALKYEAMTVNAIDAQLIEQLKMTGEMICACYHVPGYKIGVGQMPTVNNVAALNQQYYDQCLQFPIEKMERRLEEGLELKFPNEVWLDLGALLRMDPETRRKSHGQAIKDGWLKPNEARREEDLEPVEGGDTPYLQQQNYSLAALAKRDAREDPFASTTPPASPQAPAPGDAGAAGDVSAQEAARILDEILASETEELRVA